MTISAKLLLWENRSNLIFLTEKLYQLFVNQSSQRDKWKVGETAPKTAASNAKNINDHIVIINQCTSKLSSHSFPQMLCNNVYLKTI